MANLFQFDGHAEFRHRAAELDALVRWWSDAADRLPVVVAGRRRTGKSWLCRELAHGRPADVLVCDRRAERDQLAGFAARLGAGGGAPAEAPDLRGLLRLLFRRARERPRLAVIDAVPELLRLGHNAGAALAEVLREEAPTSRLKLVLCGSQVATMAALLRGALDGRGHWLEVSPLGFPEARQLLGRRPAAELVARFAVAGGMPGYLRTLAGDASLRAAVCRRVLDPSAPLFDETRRALEGEQVGGAVHFSLLRALAEHRELAWDALLARSGVDEGNASRAMRTLQDMEIVEAASSLFADPRGRRRRYRLRDHLTRFWLRFVFPWQEELRAGRPAERHFDEVVASSLPEHAADAFEELCRDWVAGAYADRVDVVGRWWGRSRSRRIEEIAIVGGRDGRATVIGACAWGRMPARVLDQLMTVAVPTLARSGVDAADATIVLFARSGFSRQVEAADRGRVRLVGLDQVLSDLEGPTLVR